jgi:hypothetical protein
MNFSPAAVTEFETTSSIPLQYEIVSYIFVIYDVFSLKTHLLFFISVSEQQETHRGIDIVNARINVLWNVTEV